MEQEEIDFILNNNKYWRLMNEIVRLKGQSIRIINELSTALGVKDTHPYFRKIVELLIHENFMQIEHIGKNILIKKIKYKQLAKFLREGKDFKYSGNIIQMTTIGYNY